MLYVITQKARLKTSSLDLNSDVLDNNQKKPHF